MRSTDNSHQRSPLETVDPNEQLRYYLLWYIFARIVAFTSLLGITLFLQSKGRPIILPSSTITLVYISIIYFYSIGSAVILQKRERRLRRFGAYQLVIDCVVSALLVYATGCSQSIFTPLFILPIITGGLLLYTLGGLIPATAATMLYATVLFLEFFNYLPPYFADTHYLTPADPLASMNIFSIYGLLFFLTGLLSGILGNRLKTTETALSLTSRQLDRLSVLYQQIFNDITTGLITIDARGRITSLNPAAEKISGYRNEELVGRELSKVFPELIQTSSGRRVGDLQGKSGEMSRIVYSFSSLNITDKKTLQNTDYSSWKIITIEDISKIEQMEKQILEARKMAAIGELSANIAHDFRNPIAAIYGSAQIMSLELDSGDRQDNSTERRLTNIILRESERMADTIAEFLQFARPAPLACQWFDMKRLIEETIRQVSSGKPQHASCLFSLTIEDNLNGWGDQQQVQASLKHVLANSCNAVKNKSGSPVEITCAEEEWDQKNVVAIRVTDKGPGIIADIREKIFEPFFTTSEQGTGLGLAIVKQIVNRHNGSVEFESSELQGSTFILRFPLPVAPESGETEIDRERMTRR